MVARSGKEVDLQVTSEKRNQICVFRIYERVHFTKQLHVVESRKLKRAGFVARMVSTRNV
jgi:hypothetical protein